MFNFFPLPLVYCEKTTQNEVYGWTLEVDFLGWISIILANY